MKTTSSLLILLSCSAVLFAGGDASFSGKSYKSDAPDGRFSIQAHQEKGWNKFDVEIIDLASNKAVLTFDPEARYIGATWSPASNLVAIEQNRTTHDSAVSVFSMGKKTAKRIILPEGCNYDDESAAVFEAPTRKHAQITRSQNFHITMAAFRIEKWIDSDTCVLYASGRGWWGGDVAQDKDRRFMANYKVTLHFAANGTASLQNIALKKYEDL